MTEHSGATYLGKAKKYAETVDSKPWNAHYERPAVTSLLPALKGTSVLDVGCGSGWYAEYLVNQGAKVTAFDLDSDFVALTRSRVESAATVHQANLAEPLTFAGDGEFDVVVCPLVLHYLEDWKPVFDEFHRVLKPRGTLVFSTHHPFNDWKLFDRDDYFAVELLEDEWDDFGKLTFYRKYERFPALIAELLAQRVEVIVTAGTPASLAVKKATTSVSLVMVAVGDSVATGLVASLARPGGNITGLTSTSEELDGKRLELLRQVIPKLSHVAVFWNPENPTLLTSLKEIRAAAQVLGMKVQVLDVRTPGELEESFKAIGRERPGALLVLGDRLFLHNRQRIMEFATKQRLPVVPGHPELVEAGGLMSLVGSGLVPSLARPGRNVTGISLMAPDLVGKQLQLLREMVPNVSRMALLRNPANPASAPQLREAEAAALALGVRLQTLEARAPQEIDRAFAAMTREGAGGRARSSH